MDFQLGALLLVGGEGVRSTLLHMAEGTWGKETRDRHARQETIRRSKGKQGKARGGQELHMAEGVWDDR